MGWLSSLFFKGCHKQFTFCGSPVQFRGPGHKLTVSIVETSSSRTCVGEAKESGNAVPEPVKIHCLPGYVSALYLVEYPRRSSFLLLDCGSPSDGHRIRFYLERTLSSQQQATTMLSQEEVKEKRPVSDGEAKSSGAVKGSEGSARGFTLERNLHLAAISHCHIDHSGAAGFYSRHGVPVTWPERIEKTYLGYGGRVRQLVEVVVVSSISRRLGRVVYENLFESSRGLLGPYFEYPRRTNAAVLKDGDALPCGFDDWRAVWMPGHTAHMVGFYHQPSQIFYCADLFVKIKRGYFPPFVIHYEWAYRHTLERVRQLKVRCLLLPHGGVVDLTKGHEADPAAAWSRILDEVLANLERRMLKKNFVPVTMWHRVGFLVQTVVCREKKEEREAITPGDLEKCGEALPSSLEGGMAPIKT